jgi:hypothetical protein
MSSMAFCGDCVLARHGATFPRSMATGIRSIGGSDDGASPVSGRASPSRSPRPWPRAVNTTSTAPRFAVMSRQRAAKGAHQRALGRLGGGFTSKVHCLGDARGWPIAFHFTPGEAADCKAYDTLIDLPEQAPDALLADNELLVLVCAAVKPADVLEEIWVRDIVDLSWEVLRWRRLKASLLQANAHKGVEAALKPLVEDIEAHVLAKSWAQRGVNAIKQVENKLALASLSMDAVHAQTVVANLVEVECIERMTTNAEVRRNAALHEVSRHRQSFGQALRRASDEIADAEFRKIDAPRIEDRKAAWLVNVSTKPIAPMRALARGHARPPARRV